MFAATTALLVIYLINASHQSAENQCKDFKGCCASHFVPSECQPASGCSCHPLCVATDTCCSDYDSFCHSRAPIDCRYGEWGEWRDNSASSGVQRRMRTIDYFGNLNGQICSIEDIIDYRQIRPAKVSKMVSQAIARLWEDFEEGKLVSANVNFTPKKPASCFNSRACLMCTATNPQCSLLMAKFQQINYQDVENEQCYGSLSLADGPLANLGCTDRDGTGEDIFVLLPDKEQFTGGGHEKDDPMIAQYTEFVNAAVDDHLSM